MNKSKTDFRCLTSDERSYLESQGNQCSNWDLIYIKGELPRQSIRSCRLEGTIYLDELEYCQEEYQGRIYQTGLEDSVIRDCIISGRASVIQVKYLRGYKLEDQVLLLNIQEMIYNGESTFGQGYPGEECLGKIEAGNEAGTRWILPFKDILPPDIRLWLGLRGNKKILETFQSWTKSDVDQNKTSHAVISGGTVIKNSTTIRNIQILGKAEISGALRLDEITIMGSHEAPVRIEEGSGLRWGILQEGARVSGSLAEHFYLGAHSNLTKGARYIHSCLSENSTISCCEVISVFTGAFHEQHHNNSFLIASTLEGQSNVAAGATIGSNHNSRGADGEIRAGRGFWPALNLSLKHNSRFASFTLIARGQYNSELNIGLPFSLVSQTETELHIMPAYWQQYNLYALARNSWKFKKRDKRSTKNYLIETHWLAPDTVTEIQEGIRFLKDLLSVAQYKNRSEDMPEILLGNEFMENSNRPVRILKPNEAIRIYRQLLDYYLLTSMINYLEANGIDPKEKEDMDFIQNLISQCPDGPNEWTNLAGTPISKEELDSWQNQISQGKLKGWSELHDLYMDWMKRYPEERLKHALCIVLLSPEQRSFCDVISSALDWEIKQWEGIRSSRLKDVQHPFRHITYDSPEEQDELVISLEEDPFIQEYQEDMQRRISKIKVLQNLCLE